LSSFDLKGNYRSTTVSNISCSTYAVRRYTRNSVKRMQKPQKLH